MGGRGFSMTLTKYHQIHLLNLFPSEVKFQQTRQLKISGTSPRSYICPLVPMVAMSANMQRVLFFPCEVNGSEFQTRTGSRRFHPHKHEVSSKNNAFRTKTTGNWSKEAVFFSQHSVFLDKNCSKVRVVLRPSHGRPSPSKGVSHSIACALSSCRAIEIDSQQWRQAMVEEGFPTLMVASRQWKSQL